MTINVDKEAIQSNQDFFQLLLCLGLKIAFFDKSLHINENKIIEDYFVNVLGFEAELTKQKIGSTIPTLSGMMLTDVAKDFSVYVKESAPMNIALQILEDSYSFLNSIVEADGVVDEAEILALEEIKRIFGVVS